METAAPYVRADSPCPREVRVFNSADEVLKFIRDEGVQFVDVRFCDLPGMMQHFTFPVENFGDERLHRRPDVRRLVDPRLPGRSTSRTCSCCPTRRRAVHRPVPPAQDAEHQLLRARPADRRGLQPRPAQRRPQGRGLPRAAPASPTRPTSAPRPSSTSSTTSASRPTPARRLLLHRLGRGRLEHRPRGGGRQPRLQAARTRGATSRCRRWTTSPTCARRWSAS